MKIDRPITIAITLFVILLVVFFFTWPEYKSFVSLQNELGQKKAEYSAQHDYYATIAKIDLDLKNHKEDLMKIDDALPQDSALGKVVYSLQQTAQENGLMVKDLFLSKSSNVAPNPNTTTNIKDIFFSMDLIGTYPALENFIISLEKSSRIFEVTSIFFGATQSLSGSSSIIQNQQGKPQQATSFNLQIKTHSY